MFIVFLHVLKREWILLFRNKYEVINPLLFFIIVSGLFPLAISPDPKILNLLAPGIIWVAALLATSLNMDKLFKSDFEDGSLEQMLLSSVSLNIIVLAKILSYWLFTCVPLIVISPIIVLMFQLSLNSDIAVIMSLLLGMPILCFLGAIGSALTVGLRNSGLLLMLLILPLYIPPLIFGTTIITAANHGLSYMGQIAFLGALLTLAITLCPIAISAILKISVNY